MIQKMLINLVCTGPGTVHGHAGSELHGLFFKVLEEIDGELATMLHNTAQKPFSIGSLVGTINRKKVLPKLRKESFTLFQYHH